MELIFVYNANAGLVAGFLDSAHKMLSPSTYACDLCAITYGAFRMDRQWKAWLQARPFKASFYHRPDFRTAFPACADTALPCVFTRIDGRMAILVSADDFAGIATVEALIELIEARLSASVPVPPPSLPSRP